MSPTCSCPDPISLLAHGSCFTKTAKAMAGSWRRRSAHESLPQKQGPVLGTAVVAGPADRALWIATVATSFFTSNLILLPSNWHQEAAEQHVGRRAQNAAAVQTSPQVA